jgi:hypothetical protein
LLDVPTIMSSAGGRELGFDRLDETGIARMLDAVGRFCGQEAATNESRSRLGDADPWPGYDSE